MHKKLCILVLFLLIFSSLANSVDIHMVIGYVYANGKPIPNINLTIINEDKNQKIYRKSDKYGFYSFNIGTLHGPGWEVGDRLLIIAKGKNYYGEARITIDGSAYQWVNITLFALIKANFSYSPMNPTDIDTLYFFDMSDGQITNYTWQFGDGNFSYKKNPMHRYANNGIYNVTLIVNGGGAMDSISKKIKVENIPPIAVFFYRVHGYSVEVNASKSSDLDGYIVSYEWKWDNGEWIVGNAISHHSYKEGEHEIWLRVKDDDGSTNVTENEIYIQKNIGIAPKANFYWKPAKATDLDMIRFNSTSYDIDGNIVNYTWQFGDGNFSYKKNPMHRYANNGIYNVTLIVKDDDGMVSKMVKKILILNNPPVSDFYFKIKKNSVQFIQKSSDLDGIITNYTWQFGDGNFSYKKNPMHQYANNGIYNVTLIVKDDDGMVSEKNASIKISNEAPSFEVIVFLFALMMALIFRKLANSCHAK